MRVLGIETSTEPGSIAIIDDERILGEYSLSSQPSLWLILALDRVLFDLGLSCKDIDRIVVSRGPGSFTGTRIGVATAMALSYSLGISIVGVPSMDAVAYNLVYTKERICVLLDAKKGELYVAFFRSNGHSLTQESDYMVLSPKKVVELINEPTILVGSGLFVYGQFIKSELGEMVTLTNMHTWIPRASSVAMLGRHLKDDTPFLPLYLRSPVS